jgi:hypothetical protein
MRRQTSVRVASTRARSIDIALFYLAASQEAGRASRTFGQYPTWVEPPEAVATHRPEDVRTSELNNVRLMRGDVPVAARRLSTFA